MARIFVLTILCSLWATAAFAQESFRTWTNKSGAFTIEAKLVEYKDGMVRLEYKTGKTHDIPLNLLSAADQEFVLSQDDEPESKNRTSVTRSKPIVSGAVEVKIPPSPFWEVAPDVFQGPEIGQDPIDVSDDFRQHAALLMPPDRSAALVSTLTRGQTQMCVFDLVNGQIVGEPFMVPRTYPVAISPDKTQLLTTDRFMGVARLARTLNVIETGARMKLRASWNPYGDFGSIFYTQFIDDDHLITVNHEGDLGLWTISKLKLIWKARIWPLAIPALSPNRKHLFVHENNRLVAIECLTGKVLGQVAARSAGMRGYGVNDSATRLAAAGAGILRVWDLTTGKKIEDFAISAAVRYPKGVIWLNDRQLLVRTRSSLLLELIDIELKSSVWAYHSGIKQPDGVNGEIRFIGNVTHVSQQASLRVPEIPHPEARQAIDSFNSQPILEIPPGSKVNVDLVVEPPHVRGEEIQKLKKVFDTAGLTMVNSGGVATFQVNMRASGPNVMNHFDSTDEGKQQKVEILLVSHDGREILWRASRDYAANQETDYWTSFVLPEQFRISKVNLDNSGMMWDGSFAEADLFRDYSNGQYYQESGFRTGNNKDQPRRPRGRGRRPPTSTPPRIGSGR